MDIIHEYHVLVLYRIEVASSQSKKCPFLGRQFRHDYLCAIELEKDLIFFEEILLYWEICVLAEKYIIRIFKRKKPYDITFQRGNDLKILLEFFNKPVQPFL